MRKTKPLSTTEYTRYAEYNRKEDIKRLANIEARRACQIEGHDFEKPPEIPQYHYSKPTLPDYIKNALKGTLGKLQELRP